MSNPLLIAYYGDDFTGSTDALEVLCMAGAETILFIEPPSTEQIAAHPTIQAIGVAGKTRAMDPQAMDETLTKAFAQLKNLSPNHVHYKVCSTFDSSPTVGSIGKAIEIGLCIFNRKFIPLLVAAPSLGRYSLFGNLFARMGIGSKGSIYRLDKHPSMSKHPVTPATESDLRLHLAKQTNQRIELVDVLQIDQATDAIIDTIDSYINESTAIVLFDALHEKQLPKIGAVIDSYSKSQTLFSVGSSGITSALTSHWINQSILFPKNNWPIIVPAKPLLVISGTCSPVTAAQIKWAVSNGFKEVILNASQIQNKEAAEMLVQQAIATTITYLLEGISVIVHTGPRLQNNISSNTIGTILGTIAKEAIEKTNIKRLVIAGGDTSSYAALALGIQAVQMIAPLVIGSPLCKAISNNTAIQNIEVNFKGGQVGTENYFGILESGKIN